MVVDPTEARSSSVIQGPEIPLNAYVSDPQAETQKYGPENLMRSRIDEKYNQSSASYLRWSATGTIQGGCGSQPLHGISEYIRIRPVMYGELSNRQHR